MTEDIGMLFAYFLIYALGHCTIVAFYEEIEDIGYSKLFKALDVGFVAGMVIYTILIVVEVFK